MVTGSGDGQERTENSERTSAPAGLRANERVSTYSSGHTLTASRTAEKTATSDSCQSSIRAAVEMPVRNS